MKKNKVNITVKFSIIIIIMLSLTSSGLFALDYPSSDQNMAAFTDSEMNNSPMDTITIPGRGFHESLLRISLVLGIFMINPWGEMQHREKMIYDENKSNIPSLDDNDLNDVKYTELHKGCELDIMLPSIKYALKKDFDLTGVKFGLRTRYTNSEVIQYIYGSSDSGQDNSGESSDQLMKYNQWEIGPTADIIFSPRSNNFNIVLHSNLLVGYISNGKLQAVSALREAGQIYSKSDYYTEFDGISFSIGIGPHIVLNRWLPVTFGFTISYTYSQLFLDNELSAYDNNSSTSFNDLSIELSLGTHIL